MDDKRVLQAGNYIGTIEDYGISNNKKGEPQAFIKFKINKGEGQGFAELTWYSGLSEKVAEGKKTSPGARTITVLLDCGFKGEYVEDLAGGISSNVIDGGKEMALTIQDNEYEGKVSSRIQWVNPIGGGGPKKVTKEELAGKTNASALRAMLIKERANRPTDDMPEEPPF